MLTTCFIHCTYAVMKQGQERIAAWMQRVMVKNNWTAEEWARRAGTSPTNLTRFLGSGEHTTSGNTLIKLATAAKSTPPIGPEALSPTTEIPFYEDFMGKILKGTFTVPSEVSASSFAIELESDTMTLGGLLPGDTLVCEPESVRPHRNGSILCYLLDGVVSAGKLYPPYLMPSSSDADNLPVNVKNVTIVGTVVTQVRDLG